MELVYRQSGSAYFVILHSTTEQISAMELKKDLLIIKNKSIIRIIAGIIFLVLSSIWLSSRILENQIISPFDWVYSGCFVAIGILNIIEGYGFSVAKQQVA